MMLPLALLVFVVAAIQPNVAKRYGLLADGQLYHILGQSSIEQAYEDPGQPTYTQRHRAHKPRSRLSLEYYAEDSRESQLGELVALLNRLRHEQRVRSGHDVRIHRISNPAVLDDYRNRHDELGVFANHAGLDLTLRSLLRAGRRTNDKVKSNRDNGNIGSDLQKGKKRQEGLPERPPPRTGDKNVSKTNNRGQPIKGGSIGLDYEDTHKRGKGRLDDTDSGKKSRSQLVKEESKKSKQPKFDDFDSPIKSKARYDDFNAPRKPKQFDDFDSSKKSKPQFNDFDGPRKLKQQQFDDFDFPKKSKPQYNDFDGPKKPKQQHFDDFDFPKKAKPQYNDFDGPRKPKQQQFDEFDSPKKSKPQYNDFDGPPQPKQQQFDDFDFPKKSKPQYNDFDGPRKPKQQQFDDFDSPKRLKPQFNDYDAPKKPKLDLRTVSSTSDWRPPQRKEESKQSDFHAEAMAARPSPAMEWGSYKNLKLPPSDEWTNVGVAPKPKISIPQPIIRYPSYMSDEKPRPHRGGGYGGGFGGGFGRTSIPMAGKKRLYDDN